MHLGYGRHGSSLCSAWFVTIPDEYLNNWAIKSVSLSVSLANNYLSILYKLEHLQQARLRELQPRIYDSLASLAFKCGLGDLGSTPCSKSGKALKPDLPHSQGSALDTGLWTVLRSLFFWPVISSSTQDNFPDKSLANLMFPQKNWSQGITIFQ